MTAAAPLSVIVVSHGRPAALTRCLTALTLQDHPALELVVVACAAGRAAFVALGLEGRAKLVACDLPNIAVARNLGLQAAAGALVAYVDDDAVAEPSWAGRLAAAFDDPRVEAATGFVRGRDGLGFQHRAAWVDAVGRDRPLQVEGDAVSLHQGAPGSAVKTQGTNMAFRRETLAAIGGFDPAFAFYLDETDVNMRMAAEELITAVVPRAEVQHAVAAGPRRRADRAPLTLFDIGVSAAVFLRKHAPGIDPAGPLEALIRAQRRRLLRLMVIGALEPRDIGRLLAGLEAGIAEGLARELAAPLPVGPPPAPWLALPGTGPRPGRVVAGWRWRRRRLARLARAHAGEGAVVTVLQLSAGWRRHRMRFTEAGYWLQTGGLWGRSLRDAPAPPARGPAARLRHELVRLAAVRPVDSLLG